MPRRREVPKRKVEPDPKYRNRIVSKFVNKLMYSGKKSTAEKILYGAFDVIEERYKQDPMDVFKKAIENVKPKLEVKSRRVGGATYQVPIEVRPERRNALAIRWIIGFAWFFPLSWTLLGLTLKAPVAMVTAGGLEQQMPPQAMVIRFGWSFAS